MLTPEKVVLKNAYQLCNKCGIILGSGTKAWVLAGVFLCGMCYSAGRYTLPWKKALATNKLKEGTAEHFNAVANLYTHYQRECQYVLVGEPDEEWHGDVTEEPKEVVYPSQLNQDSLLGFFIDEEFRLLTLEQVELEHRVCNWERVHGKSAYCLGRTMGDIEAEIEARRKSGT